MNPNNSSTSKRLFLSALLGTSVGIGVGLATAAIWNALSDRSGRRSESDRVNTLLNELAAVKAELSDMRDMLRSSHRQEYEIPLEEIPPFYLSDEDDEFFDIISQDSGPETILADDATSTTTGNYYSATSLASSKSSTQIRLGPPVPQEVLEELDQIAAYALGDCPMVSSTPKVGANGDDCNPGSQAYSRCLVYKSKYRRSPEFLWRFGRAIYLASQEADSNIEESATCVNDPEVQSEAASVCSQLLDPRSSNDIAYELKSRRQFLESGLAIARRALILARRAQNQPDLMDGAKSMAEVYKWLAVFVGLACDFCGVQQRISYGFEFRDLLDKAIELNAEDADIHYMKGRWCYQVYNLSWVERQFAARLFASPPTATLEEAIESLQEAERLRPDHYAANQLYLAKCYISRWDYKEAGYWLGKARSLLELNRYPPPHLDTKDVRDEITSLASKYAYYCT